MALSPSAIALLAALSDVVVVVESRHHGGSRHTVEAALALGIPLGAVPGSIRSPTSEGTNALLCDGAFPVCSITDILVALSLAGGDAVSPLLAHPEAPIPTPVYRGEDQALYELLTSEPTSLEELARLSGLDLPSLCGGLERLASAGVARDLGGWWERT